MDISLRRSADRKVAFDPTPKGNIRVANSFGIPAGPQFSCPTATSICESICYAQAIENRFRAVDGMMRANYEALLYADYLTGVAGMEALIETMVFEFDAECDKKHVEKAFRIHWDGDFYSLEYAQAWANVVKRFPDIRFWVYTRAFTPTLNVIPALANIPNLTVYLSVDEDNKRFAPDILAEWPTVIPSVLSDTMDNAAEVMKDLTGKPGAKCPELIGAIPLISAEGGACAVCRLCVDGKAPVRFAHKKAGRK